MLAKASSSLKTGGLETLSDTLPQRGNGPTPNLNLAQPPYLLKTRLNNPGSIYSSREELFNKRQLLTSKPGKLSSGWHLLTSKPRKQFSKRHLLKSFRGELINTRLSLNL